MLKSSLCDYSDAYILVKGTISANNTAAVGADANNTNRKVIFKNCAPFTNCIYCNYEITEFRRNNTTDSFKFKAKITGQTGDDGTKDVEIMVPLKYLSNFWRILEMPLINC